MRRQFALPAEDIRNLDALELQWETIKEGNAQWLIVHDWAIPVGYQKSVVDVALRIMPSYPDEQIDMAYFTPCLELISGRQIKATQVRQSIDQKQWQRWSRHRKAPNLWRPGIDCIVTHLNQTRAWLQREV